MPFKRSPYWKDEDGFPAWLAGELESRDWSLSELARRIDTKPSVVSRWMLGEFSPGAEYAARIADAFGMDQATVMIQTGALQDISAEDDDPRTRSIIALVRQIDMTDERYGVIRSMLEMMRRYPRVQSLSAL